MPTKQGHEHWTEGHEMPVAKKMIICTDVYWLQVIVHDVNAVSWAMGIIVKHGNDETQPIPTSQ